MVTNSTMEMKNKFLLITGFLFFIIAGSIAQVRAVEEAMSIAQSFLPGNANSIKLVYTSKSKLRSGTDKAYFYAFNRGEGNGYVLVSADGRTKDVLGYADEGAFDFNNLPGNFKSWLAFYEAEMESLDNPAAKTSSPAPGLPRPVRTASPTVLEPMVRPLIQTKWGQDEPYNNLCPLISKEHAPAGCVATVMAQIMKYYEWPVQGAGSHAYTLPATGEELSADFSATVYDWADMLGRYAGNEGGAAQDAVATLIYHCGVAVEMEYGLEGSGAYDTDVPSALETYFGYDPGMNTYVRDYYSHEDWSRFIKAELTAKRPVYYSGVTGGNSGHAFVCDGYNAEGFFHFNWGWNGYADGYFELSALNPNSPGIGGGWEGFNYSQRIITGIQPAAGTSAPAGKLGFSSISSNKTSLFLLTEKFTVSLTEVTNRGNKTFNGYIGLALCREDNTIIQYTRSYQMDEGGLPPYWGYPELPFRDYSLPRTLSAGTYKIIPAYSYEIAGQSVLMEGTAGQVQSLTVTVSQGKQVSIAQAAPDTPQLELESFATLANFYQGKTGQFSAAVKNTGTGDYNSSLVLAFAGETIREPVVILPGATRTAGFSTIIYVTPGTYTAKLFYDENNDSFNPEWVVLDSISVTVNETPLPAEISLLSASFPDALRVNKESPKLSAAIKNTGGLYDGEFTAAVFSPEGITSLTDFGFQQVLIDNNETKTLLFDTPVDLPKGNYLVAIFYRAGTWVQLSKTIAVTFIDPVIDGNEQAGANGLHISLGPSVLHLQSGEIVEALAIYDLSGRLQLQLKPNTSGTISVPVQQLAPASYILRVQTKGKVQATKFMKK